MFSGWKKGGIIGELSIENFNVTYRLQGNTRVFARIFVVTCMPANIMFVPRFLIIQIK